VHFAFKGKRVMKVIGFNHLSIRAELRLLAAFADQDEQGLAASLYLDWPHVKTARRAG
jgi:hypothetical protein